jgi:mercuric ion transport protein
MQSDRALLATGTVGVIITAICCTTPLLAILLGGLGLTAWLARADYVLIPALLICLGLIGGAGLYLRRNTAQASCDPTPPNKALNHE